MIPTRLPSIRARLGYALLLWSLVWGLAIAVAVGYAAQREVDELLDESQQITAMLLQAALQAQQGDDRPVAAVVPLPADTEGNFAWQVVAADGSVLQRSASAPVLAFHAAAAVGFTTQGEWRVFGSAMGHAGRVLYVAHALRERVEAQAEVAMSAVLAALSIGLLGHWWLRTRVRHELRPLERLSNQLAGHDPLDRSRPLGGAERAELAPMHAAIDQLGQRLARRVTHERAFSAHAAHALRTPLAGMEAQLAVALRECTPAQALRLQRVREASHHLQRVVQSLLDLFRVGSEVRREPVDIQALLAHLPVEGLEVTAEGVAPISADPDLLAAAMANLLDNAKRYGARRVVVSSAAPGTLRLQDDGPGTTPARLQELREALGQQDYEGHTGLGLMLADLVARAHGGALSLPPSAQGFAVELALDSAAGDGACIGSP
jgi:signal transduction histidine kinase